MFTLIGFAFMPWDGQFEDDDLSFLEGGTAIWNVGFLPPALSVTGFQLVIAAIIPIFEYLQTHVGEKRPASQIISLNNSPHAHFFSDGSVLQCRHFLFSAPNCKAGNLFTKGSRSILIFPISSKANFQFMEVFSLCIRSSNQVCSKKNF
ncbi:MAG TPA: hypothetical protein VLE49_19470 [Anaerolineales bacterium]|nr:hypothetical protein [Anaerolineales bacterium]